MKVSELYRLFSARYPASLSAEWDNDGIMCMPKGEESVKRVLCTLDVTEAAVERAIVIGANVILSHHPLLFHPLSSVTSETAMGRKLIAVIRAEIAVFSFHTRADSAEMGVNDLLAEAISLTDVTEFSEHLGRIGNLSAPQSLSDFCSHVRSALGTPLVLFGDAHRPVFRVAVVGGSGKSEALAAKNAGADTFLSGRLSYELLNEAVELGINLLEAGHFYTEALLPQRWVRDLVALGIESEYFPSCSVQMTGDF